MTWEVGEMRYVGRAIQDRISSVLTSGERTDVTIEPGPPDLLDNVTLPTVAFIVTGKNNKSAELGSNLYESKYNLRCVIMAKNDGDRDTLGDMLFHNLSIENTDGHTITVPGYDYGQGVPDPYGHLDIVMNTATMFPIQDMSSANVGMHHRMEIICDMVFMKV